MMKLAIVSPWAVSATAVGGTERFIVDLAESFSRSGHEVDVYMFDGSNHEDNGVRYLSVNLLGTEVNVDEYTLRENLGDFSKVATYDVLAKKIESLVDLSNYDAIHINTQLLLQAWKNKRRIFTIHTNPFEYKQAWGDNAYDTMVAIAHKEAENSQTVFTAPSMHYTTLFSDDIKTEVVCIPHAISPSRVQGSRNKHALCVQYGLDESKLHILLPSRLEPVQKQPWLLFDALKHLSPELCRRIEILSSGVDKQYEQYRQLYTKQAETLGCSVYFGRFEYMSDAYTLADVVVLPSQSESFGYSALESLTLGIPTILNDIPTFHEIARENSSAHFFSGEEVSLANMLKNVLTGHTERLSPTSSWLNRYSLAEWIKKYESLL
jgi:glycosyltransferase involved in cell wall biosynthesis